MPWERSDDDRPYGDPQRAANIRWESRTDKATRKTREGVGALVSILTWPVRVLGAAVKSRTRRRG